MLPIERFDPFPGRIVCRSKTLRTFWFSPGCIKLLVVQLSTLFSGHIASTTGWGGQQLQLSAVAAQGPLFIITGNTTRYFAFLLPA